PAGDTRTGGRFPRRGPAPRARGGRGREARTPDRRRSHARSGPVLPIPAAMVDAPRTRGFPSRRLATGRMAGVACLSGGLIAVIVYLTPFTPPGSRGGGLLSGETVVAIGLAAWF